MLTPLRTTVLLLFLLMAPAALCQTLTPKHISLAPATNGYYEYLPPGYHANPGARYPLLIFFHGAGDIGDGSPAQLPRLLQVGIPKLIHDGQFPASFTSNGYTSSFIVIAPQFSYWPDAQTAVQQVAAIIGYAVQQYAVDESRIYLTGISMGGGFVFDYAGNSAAHAKKLAAIVPIAEAAAPVYAGARIIAAANLPVWATHNAGDPNVQPSQTTERYITWINEAPAPNPPARKTIFNSNAHDAWTQTYDPSFRENGLNIYEWMLQYSRPSGAPQPVQLSEWKAERAGTGIVLTWTSVGESGNDHYTLERSANGVDYSTLAVIAAANAPHTYVHTDGNPVQGDNYYRLSQTGINGVPHTYDIRIVSLMPELTIAPNPVVDNLNLKLSGEERGLITVSLYTSNGAMIRQWMLQKNGALAEASYPLSDLPAGAYLLQVKSARGRQVRNIVKL